MDIPLIRIMTDDHPLVARVAGTDERVEGTDDDEH
jgi:hypothetical protein